MSKYVVMCTWDEVGHLSEKDKKELWDSIPPYQRDARARGIPQLGSGAIYPILESDISCKRFEIPKHYPRVYALDVGWNRTAAVWGATDPDQGVTYLYSEYYRAQAEPAIHAAAIRARGDWIPGVIDPSARGRSQIDGGRLIEQYENLSLMLAYADNSVESGLLSVWERLSVGKLKVFDDLPNWFSEYRIYQRDEKGKIVKRDDHLMDATRYLVMSGLALATTEPKWDGGFDDYISDRSRSATTGY